MIWRVLGLRINMADLSQRLKKALQPGLFQGLFSSKASKEEPIFIKNLLKCHEGMSPKETLDHIKESYRDSLPPNNPTTLRLNEKFFFLAFYDRRVGKVAWKQIVQGRTESSAAPRDQRKTYPHMRRRGLDRGDERRVRKEVQDRLARHARQERLHNEGYM